MNSSYIKRPFRPLYGWTQMTPKSCFLDPAWDRSTPIWPGMILTQGVGELVTLVGATGNIPYGFSGMYVGGDGIDEPLDTGLNVFAIWVMGPDAEAEILAPAFDTTLTYTDTAGAETLLYAGTTGANKGKIVAPGTSGATTAPIARLLKVNSATKLTIGGLR
jgi:hypothetical protein